MSKIITPEMVAPYYQNGELDMPIPEGCTDEYLQSFSYGFQGESLLILLMSMGDKQAYDDGKAARAHVDSLYANRIVQ